MNGKLILESVVGIAFGAVALAAILQQLTGLQTETRDLRARMKEHSALHYQSQRIAAGLAPEANGLAVVEHLDGVWVVRVGGRRVEVHE